MTIKEITDLEEELKLAMCTSDVTALDRLLSPDLIFTNHLGQLVTKQEDMEAHRQQIFVIDTLDLSNQKILILDNNAVVSTQADISGSYNDQPTSGKFMFTRVWTRHSGDWQVVAGHSSIIT